MCVCVCVNIYIYEHNLALHNPQGLIFHETQYPTFHITVYKQIFRVTKTNGEREMVKSIQARRHDEDDDN